MADSDADDASPSFRPMNDAYTGMLVVSLLALVAGCALLYLDYAQYPTKEPPRVDSSALPVRPAAIAPEEKKPDDKDKKADDKKDEDKKDQDKKADDKKDQDKKADDKKDEAKKAAQLPVAPPSLLVNDENRPRLLAPLVRRLGVTVAEPRRRERLAIES